MADPIDWRKIAAEREEADRQYSKKRKGKIRKLIEEGVEKAGAAGYPDIGAAIGTAADMAVESIPEDMPAAMMGTVGKLRSWGPTEKVGKVAGAAGKQRPGLLSKIPEKEYEQALDILRVKGSYPIEMTDEAGKPVIKYLRKEDPDVMDEIKKLMKSREQ